MRVRKRRTLSWFLMAAGLAAGGCAGTREVTLLATTDFHGALVDGGWERTSGRPWGGAVALGQLVREERAARPRRAFLLDAGDEMQGTPESNFTFGRSSVRVLNLLGVDAAALGNHEFDWGVDTLAARVREMRYPLLAANVFERGTGERPHWVRPWTLLERDGVRVGVIGFVTPDTPRVTLPTNVAHLRFDPPETLLPALVAEVRARGADVVVVLAHIGGDQDPGGAIAGPVAALALPGVDAIVGGHTHTFVAGSVAGVPVVVAGASGRGLGRITLRLEGRRVTSSEVEIRRAWADSLAVPPEDRLAAYVDSMRAAVRPLVSRVLGAAAAPFRGEALANLVTDAMRAAVGADVAVTNPGGLRRALEPGPITVGDVFELMPFENAVVTVELTASELARVLESRPEKVRLSGLSGRFDPGAAAGLRVQLYAGERPVPADRTLRVATNSFLALGGDGFVGFESGRDFTVHPLLVRDAIAAAIEGESRSGRAVAPDPAPRFSGAGGRAAHESR